MEALTHGRKRLNPAILRKASEALIESGAGIDDIEFVESLAKDLVHGGPGSWNLEDLSYAIQLLSGSQFRLRSLLRHEPPVPSAEARPRFDTLMTLLESTVPARERKSRARRHDVIMDTVVSRPGFYVTELYRFLRKVGATRLTYQTIWSDISLLQREKRILTIGGPQGSPRYCFPHPDRVENREMFYNRPFGLEATVEDCLTDRFEQTGPLVEVFLLNSQVKPMLLAAQFGVGGSRLVRSRVKVFGALSPFDAFVQRLGLSRVGSVDRLDVLSPFNIIRVHEGTEEPVWHDKRAFVGHSLYEDSITGAIRYSKTAALNT